MAYDSTKPVTGGSLVAADIRENFRALKEDGIVAIGLIGSEMFWPTETPPTGWLEEDGSSLVRATYPALFAVIGTMYGAADATHFNLPDARGRFPRIWAHGQATDPDKATRTKPTTTGATINDGDHVGTNQVDEIKSHRHVPMDGFTNQAEHQVGGSPQLTGAWIVQSGTVQNVYTSYTGGNETRPINTYRMMIIRAY